MIQLAFLLIGADSLRRRWFVIAFISALLIGFGGVLLADAVEGAAAVAVGLLGAILLARGLFALFAATVGERGPGFPFARLRAAGLIALACLILDFPLDSGFTAALLFGFAFIVDGGLRAINASLVRFPRWRAVVAWGVFEIVLAGLILTDWPIPRERNIALCMGLSLMFSGWLLLHTSLALKKLEPEAAILNLSLFGHRAWYDNAPVLLGPSEPMADLPPLTVHVWTPVGSADVATRRVILDRYVAAVDRSGAISTGHSAIEVPPDIYISHYPDEEIEQSPGDFAATLRATADNDIRGRFQPSYAEESAKWCPADAHVVFHRYDLRRLRAFWAGYKQDSTYNLTNRNCSVAVAGALDAALEGGLATGLPWLRLLRLLFDPDLWVAAMVRHHAAAMTWTPGLVLDYARAMHRLVEPPAASWAERCAAALRTLRAKGLLPHLFAARIRETQP